jgi:hypothetical protein
VSFERCPVERPKLLELGYRHTAACHHNDPEGKAAS